MERVILGTIQSVGDLAKYFVSEGLDAIEIGMFG